MQGKFQLQNRNTWSTGNQFNTRAILIIIILTAMVFFDYD